MDITQFWAIIAAVHSVSGADLDARVDNLASRLEELPPVEIASFETHFNTLHRQAYRWDLWGAAYVINGGCSDDGFTDFRSWLISEGRKTYEAALQSPDSLADLAPIDDASLEEFAYVASQVYEHKTGADIFSLDELKSAPPQARSPEGSPWREEELPRLFPRLWTRYGE